MVPIENIDIDIHTQKHTHSQVHPHGLWFLWILPNVLTSLSHRFKNNKDLWYEMRSWDKFWQNEEEPTLIMDFGSRKKLVKMLVGYLNEITGPKAKFILILCATSGMVEKAINPGRIGDKTISWKLYILMQNFINGTEWDSVLLSFVFLLHQSWRWIGKVLWVILPKWSNLSSC